MMSSRLSFAILLCFVLSSFALAYDALPRRATSIEGRWVLNTQQSDDVERILAKRLEEERARMRERMERWQRSRRPMEPDLPPIGEEGVEVPAATREARERVRRRREREEELYRRMLGVTPTLRIEQEGTRVEIVSAVESRRFDAGSKSQVSMPEGELADLSVGWDGEWFVIQRKVRSGPSALEKFRLLKKTDQLEYQMSWRGDTELAGISVRRIFDRAAGEEPVRDPDRGPVR
jgi:hypothetical protein